MKRKDALENCHILSHKIALDPTKEQEAYFFKAAGASRFAWNWTLRRWNEEYSLWKEYQCGPKPDAYKLDAELNSLKNEVFPWLKEVASVSIQPEVLRVGETYKRTWAERKKGNNKWGFPRFKGKSSPKSFVAATATKQFVVSGKTIKIRHPSVNGKRFPFIIKMREELRFQGMPLSATISLVGGRWSVAINVAIQNQIIEQRDFKEVGVDLGIKTLATLSDGTTYENPKALNKVQKKLRQLNKAHSRKQNGSKNKEKNRLKLAKLHARVTNIRKETLHTATTSIIKNNTHVGIEDLNIKGMVANRKLARAVSDVGMYEFRRQLEYKAPLHGTEISVADIWYPSSKKCSNCGYINTHLGSREEWTCIDCETTHDRDLNASINLRPSRINLKITATHAGLACGEESAGVERNFDVKLSSKPPLLEEKKQESSISLFDFNGLCDSSQGYLTNVG